MKLRRDPSDVTSKEEFEGIVAAEAQRTVAPSKVGKHYVSIELFVHFLDFLGVDTSELSLDKNWQEVLENRERLHQVVDLILAKDPEEIKEEAVKLYRYLAEEDTPEKSDVIFCFGSQSEERPKKAAELWKKGLASKIIFAGGHAFYQETEEKEAENFKKIAMELGVPEEVIMTESTSITVPDNVRKSFNYFDEIGFSYKKIICVIAPFAQRRAWACLMKYSPEGTEVYRVNTKVGERLQEDSWFRSEYGIKNIFNEWGKIWMGLTMETY
jgi:uncharacterized SAM-binding protein YcdF (DUF218 family)